MTPSGSPGLRGRTLRSFLLFGARRVVSLLVTAAGGIALARLLTPEKFGIVSIAGRVLFPALSRLQGDARRFAEATERALNRVATKDAGRGAARC